jgi:hypothetical protein
MFFPTLFESLVAEGTCPFRFSLLFEIPNPFVDLENNKILCSLIIDPNHLSKLHSELDKGLRSRMHNSRNRQQNSRSCE